VLRVEPVVTPLLEQSSAYMTGMRSLADLIM